MKRVLIIFTVICFSCLVHGETEKNETISLDVLLVEMKKAIDPEQKLADLKTRITVSELYMPLQKIKAEITTKYKTPDKLFIETVLEDGQSVIQAYNGEIGWKSENGKEPVKLKGKELDSFRFSSGLESSQYRWKELFEKIEIDKKKYNVKKYSCYKLICIPKKKYNINNSVLFYVDDQKYLIRKMELTVYSVAGDIVQNVFVEEYKKIDSVLIPVKTKTDIFGAELFLTVLECKFNKNINDRVFNFN